MLVPILLVSVLASLPFAIAGTGNAIIENRCYYDVTVISQRGYTPAEVAAYDNNVPPAPVTTVAARTQYPQQFLPYLPQGDGVSFKISTPTTKAVQFEYSIVGNELSYDISLVDCADINGPSIDWSQCTSYESGVSLYSTANDPGCGAFNCPGQKNCVLDAYFESVPQAGVSLPEGEPSSWQPVMYCNNGPWDGDLMIVMCEGNAPLSKRRDVAGFGVIKRALSFEA